MSSDLLCCTLAQIRETLPGSQYFVCLYPDSAEQNVAAADYYCIRQRWCRAKEQWELVFTPFMQEII